MIQICEGPCVGHAGLNCTLYENFAIFLLESLRELSSSRFAIQRFLVVGTVGIHKKGGRMVHEEIARRD